MSSNAKLIKTKCTVNFCEGKYVEILRTRYIVLLVLGTTNVPIRISDFVRVPISIGLLVLNFSEGFQNIDHQSMGVEHARLGLTPYFLLSKVT